MKNTKLRFGQTFVLAMMLVAMPVLADDTEAKRNEALALYEKGKAFAKAEEWEKSELEYLASLEAFAMPRTAGQLGFVQVKVGKYLDGAKNLEWFFQEDTTVDAEKREQVRPYFLTAKKNVATIRFKVEPLDATVAIDGVVVPANRLFWSYFVPAGKHTVEAKKDGFVTELQRLTLGLGTETEVTLKLVAAPVDNAGEKQEPKPVLVPKDAKMPPLVIAAWVGFGVFGGVAIGTTIGARQTYSKMEEAWNIRAYDSAQDTAFTSRKPQLEGLSTTALVTGILGLGALGYALHGTLKVSKTNVDLRATPAVNGAMLVGRW
jgi:hypothetical protein